VVGQWCKERRKRNLKINLTMIIAMLGRGIGCWGINPEIVRVVDATSNHASINASIFR
jgi:hypothetical protein